MFHPQNLADAIQEFGLAGSNFGFYNRGHGFVLRGFQRGGQSYYAKNFLEISLGDFVLSS